MNTRPAWFLVPSVLVIALGVGCAGMGASTGGAGGDGDTVPQEWLGSDDRPWRWIVIHHSATDTGNAAIFHRHHVEERGWDGLGYHFVIGNGTDSGDGEVEVGVRWREQRSGAHAATREHNDRGIGVCLVGNFDRERPSVAQLDALRRLCAVLMERFRIPRDRIYTHREVRPDPTACPGAHFDRAAFVAGLPPLSRIRDVR